MNTAADFYFKKEEKWSKHITRLREIVLDCNLVEEVKWGTPCYIYQKHNIVLIHVFKEYCALLFFKGALLTNTHSLLIQQTPKVQAARQMRFTQLSEIEEQAAIIKAHIYEAIEVEEAGLKVTLKKTEDFEVPDEWSQILAHQADVKKAFEQLTPGRQRAYLLHFAAAKQSKTRVARIEKYIPHIMQGKGLNDD